MAGESDPVILDGFHAVKHALRFGADIEQILTSDLPGALALARDLAPDIEQAIALRALALPPDAYATTVPHSPAAPVAALAHRPAPDIDVLDAGQRAAPLVLLDQPRHRGNVGATVRVAAGFGACGVVTTGDVDPWHWHVLRGSAGLHYAVRDVARLAERFPDGPLIAFDPGGDDLRNVDIPDASVLAFGSERRGLTDAVLDRADRVVAIPMGPGVSSFNLATSVAVALSRWALGRPPADA
jgi:tRNA G18 (ribose-2'-O)-methylase SpoU